MIYETDWFVFWLGILFSALITAGSLISAILLNDWNDKRKIKNTAKRSLRKELSDINQSLKDLNTKYEVNFGERSFSYTPLQFETLAYQSIIQSGAILTIDDGVQPTIRDTYSLIGEHNRLEGKIDDLIINALVFQVFEYKKYVDHITHMQVILSNLEEEMTKQIDSILEKLL